MGANNFGQKEFLNGIDLTFKPYNEYTEDGGEDQEQDDFDFHLDDAKEILDKYEFRYLEVEFEDGYYEGFQLDVFYTEDNDIFDGCGSFNPENWCVEGKEQLEKYSDFNKTEYYCNKNIEDHIEDIKELKKLAKDLHDNASMSFETLQNWVGGIPKTYNDFEKMLDKKITEWNKLIVKEVE